jgi:hypothetical protein
MIPPVRGAYRKMNQPHMSFMTVRLQLIYGFMVPDDYYDTPISKVFQFIWSVGLIKG